MLGLERRAAATRDVVVEAEPEETSDAIIGALDAALAFTAARELLSATHVASLVDMLDAVPVGETCAPVVSGGLGTLRAWAAGRTVVSAAEVADRLLDLRLEIAATLAPTPIPVPLVAV